MGDPTANQSKAKLALVPINLHAQSEIDELISQRKICGWNYTLDAILSWRAAVESGTKSLFWITIPSRSDVRAGHVALASEASPPDLDLANPDRSVMTISSFFILPEHRSGGLGNATMDVLEDLATKEPYGSPKCKAVAIDTLSKKYYDKSLPEWQYLKRELEKQPSNQMWYERRGYVAWKEEPRYQDSLPDGTGVIYDAVFLKKVLR